MNLTWQALTIVNFTPVEHPEGTQFNGAGGVNMAPQLNRKAKAPVE